MVHSGYHPHKPCPLRLVLGWCTEDIILLNVRPLRLVLGWCTVGIIILLNMGIILLNIVLLG